MQIETVEGGTQCRVYTTTHIRIHTGMRFRLILITRNNRLTEISLLPHD